MTFAQEIILLFTRFPEPGKSKTRLIPHLGAEGAADLQRTMTQLISNEIGGLSSRFNIHLEVHFAGGSREKIQQWLGHNLSCSEQSEGGLGTRMFNAIRPHLGRYSSIVLVGSDCPSIDTFILKSGLDALQTHDIVLGPAFDGGYYLIGTRGDIDENDLKFLFTAIDWGTEDVLRQTIKKLDARQLRYLLLKKLHDIDTPEDLRYFHHYTNS